MESPGISTTVALTGMLPFVVLVAAALSLPVCWLLLRLYRAAVLRGMDARAGAGSPPAAHARRSQPALPLRITELEQYPDSGSQRLRQAARGRGCPPRCTPARGSLMRRS
jgi:hypothetical protein